MYLSDPEHRFGFTRNTLIYFTGIGTATTQTALEVVAGFLDKVYTSTSQTGYGKLLHRFEDVRKVKAEVRHAELENLRPAARIVVGQENVELLDDPDCRQKSRGRGCTLVHDSRSVNMNREGAQ